MSTNAQGSGGTAGAVLTRSAMLATLHIHAWVPKKVDNKITRQTVSQNNAVSDAGVFIKNLIAKQHLNDIVEISGELRRFHKANTLPWEDVGPRLLPTKNYKKYTSGLNGLKLKFDQAVSQFMNIYRLCVKQAESDLGLMFNRAEYPRDDVVLKKFSVQTDLNPVPDSQDFRVQMSAAEKAQIQQEIEERVQKRHDAAVKDTWDRLYDVVQTMAEKLSDPNGKVYDSYFKNAEELVNLLPSLNFNNDPKLNDMCTEVMTKLCSYSPGVVRKDKTAKAEVAKSASDLLSQFPGFSGGDDGSDA